MCPILIIRFPALRDTHFGDDTQNFSSKQKKKISKKLTHHVDDTQASNFTQYHKKEKLTQERNIFFQSHEYVYIKYIMSMYIIYYYKYVQIMLRINQS